MDIEQAIEEAIQEELDAQVKYRAAAASSPDAQTRLMFEQMAREEEMHEKRLRDRLRALKLIKQN